MKNCPTCGQTILPSMGNRLRKAAAETEQTGLTILLNTGDSTASLKAETTRRGYKAQHVHRVSNQRYRIRLNILSFPRKGTIGGKVIIVKLGPVKVVTSYDLPEQPSTYPVPPMSHEWRDLKVDMGSPIPITISLTVA